MLNGFLIICFVIFSVSRIVIGFELPPSPMTWLDAYKDFAHVFMGMLLGLMVSDRDRRYLPDGLPKLMFWTLCLVEVVMAITSASLPR